MRALPFSRAAVTVLLVTLALWLTGCAGYRLGPSNGTAAGARSIEIRPFANQTFEPRLTEAITQQLRKQLQKDGTFRLSTDGGADVTVSGSLVKYEREPLSFQPRDVITTRDYSINVTARVQARDNGTGHMLIDQAVAGRTTVRNVPDLASAERQAATLLAENLAQNIRSLLVDGAW